MTHPPASRAEGPRFPWPAFLRVALGALFVVSGYTKLSQPRANFVAVIEAYDFLGPWAAGAASHIVPWAEFIGGAFLALGLWWRPALAVIWTLNTAFLGVLIQALLRRLPIDKCGCFGELLAVPPQAMAAVDAGLWLICAFLWVGKRGGALGLDARFEKDLKT